MKKLIMAMAILLAASSVWAIQGTIKTATDTKKGDIKWQSRAKAYLIAIKSKGGADINAEYPLDDVEALDIDKPANYDKLVQMVTAGQGAQAIAGLTKIVQDYKMLVWDKPAGRYLVEAYLAANNAQKAFETAQTIISDDKSAAWSGELAPAYWQALLKLGKQQQLENCLRKATESGDRASSAAALSMRGDMILQAEGDTEAAYRKALTDAYLRVALMYTDEPCRAARQTALLKAAQCFDKLNMASRAEGLRNQAKAL